MFLLFLVCAGDRGRVLANESMNKKESGEAADRRKRACQKPVASEGSWRGMLVILLCAFLALTGIHLATGILRDSFPSVWRSLGSWSSGL